MISSQSQRSGDHSSQIQAQRDVIIYQGVTEERALAIAREVAIQAMEQYALDAVAVAKDRIDELTQRLIPQLAEQGRLGAFADPAFQVALKHAQIGAASTERDVDYDMLASLLNDHAGRAGVRPVRASIRRAIEVVDQLDTVALRALTIHAALMSYFPGSGTLDKGLQALEEMHFDLVGDEPLPKNRDWIEHLDVLDAVRVNTAASFRKYRDYLPPQIVGHLAVGLEVESPELADAMERLRLDGVRVSPVAHSLKEGFVRLPVPNERVLRELLERIVGPWRVEAVTPTVMEAFKFEVDSGLVDALMDKIGHFPKLSEAVAWWDTAEPYFQVTPVGRVLARANASRLYRGSLPPME